jgi:formylmethanofuran--tetrahydromethanopterin N-formyltransferase
MEIAGTIILDEFAEAFPVWISRVIITGEREWAYLSAVAATGFASSRIGCPCEAGIEREVSPEETPDKRTGFSILICGEKKQMKQHVAARVSQCVLPVPTVSAFDGLPDAKDRFFIRMHYFGDGYEKRCMVDRRTCWKIPIMQGEYTGEERFGTIKGIAGGNFLVMGKDPASALDAAKAGAAAIAGMQGVITSFPGGVVASGSKVGARNYRFPMPASTNHAFCPSLGGMVPESKVPDGIKSIFEIVINGIDELAVTAAMKTGILAAAATGRARYIGASNFGGKLGQYHLSLHDLFRRSDVNH